MDHFGDGVSLRARLPALAWCLLSDSGVCSPRSCIHVSHLLGSFIPKYFLFLDTIVNGIIFLKLFFGLLVSRNAADFCVDFVFGTCLLGLTVYVKCVEFSSYLIVSSEKR